MPISVSTSGTNILDAAMSLVDIIPATAYPTTDFNYVASSISGNVVTFRYEKDSVFQFNIVVTDPLGSSEWEINTTP